MRTRLNKYLSQCGLGSRRGVEKLIEGGRIVVNKEKISNLALMIEEETDKVYLDGNRIKPLNVLYYLIFNKPKGYITTLKDEKGRSTVMDIIPEKYYKAGVFPVGRLDKDTEGLLFFTNDGDLANKLNHPKFKVPKEYIVDIDKPLQNPDKLKMQNGIFIHQIKVKTGRAKIKIIEPSGKRIRFTIREGKKRQIRYTFQKFGYKVLNLKRVKYGPLSLGHINRGDFRLLKKSEIDELKKAIK